jgi:hypothetical protein
MEFEREKQPKLKLKWTDIPVEQSTAVTDIFIAIVAIAGICYLRYPASQELWKVNLWSAAFGFIAISGGLGAIAHGVCLPEIHHQRIWQLLNLALGLSVSLFVVGVVYDIRGVEAARRVLPLMLLLGVSFYLVTRLVPGTFFIFIVYEAVALFFACGSYLVLALQSQLNGSLVIAAGVFTCIVAACFQVNKKLSFKLIWQFDHNGIFHLLQIVGLVLLVVGLRLSIAAR